MKNDIRCCKLQQNEMPPIAINLNPLNVGVYSICVFQLISLELSQCQWSKKTPKILNEQEIEHIDDETF